jgi:hypothetical protein
MYFLFKDFFFIKKKNLFFFLENLSNNVNIIHPYFFFYYLTKLFYKNKNLGGKNLANIFWGMSVLRIENDEFLDKIEK